MALRIPRPWRFAILSRLRGGSYAARSLGVVVGDGCRIYSCKVASEYWMVSIGDRTTISVDVLFVTHDGTGWLLDDAAGRRYRYAPIVVGSDCFVGARVTIMPGVHIGNRVVVAAGAVVTKSVPDGLVVAGVPARPVGTYDNLLDRIRRWPTHAQRQGKTYRELVESIAEQDFVPPMSI